MFEEERQIEVVEKTPAKLMKILNIELTEELPS